MNLLQPRLSDEVEAPLVLTDPTLADRPFWAQPAAGAFPQATPPTPRPLGGAVRSAGVTDLLSAYAAGILTPSSVIAELKAAIDTSKTGQEAVIRFCADYERAASDSTRRWQQGAARPLEGVPFGVKDIIDVAGTMATAGSWFTGNRVADTDASVVTSLREAGAIPFVITATTEYASGSPHNPRFGTVTNPWDETRWTGGSSTGSGATLAARLLPFALGTDTGGSIRVPSCWCGTTGLKPGRELVSRAGVAPLSWTLDHIGPMTRSARDIAMVLPHMTDVHDPQLFADCQSILNGADIAGLRIGVPINWFTEDVDAAVLGNWRAALEDLRAQGCELIDLPFIPVEPLHKAGWTVLLSELAAFQSDRIDRADLFDRGLLVRLKQGMLISAADYGKALMTRVEAQQTFFRAMQGVDLIITPGLGGEAGSLDTLTIDVNGKAFAFQDVISRNTMIFDFTGFPSLMLPSGLGSTGLPTGIQIVGRPGSEALCLKAGAAFQSATTHHLNAPSGIPT